ncbi:neutral zinc metallopeptidase [Crossiella sp. SN42]|uniref:KPN_02809 family neutral zinc metallopeptidase n=1 Tax=Crossiella sp. SN42 TaxID=2944808 RepID=UPI00207CC627|nr:neutral zinc metallopeptidase [Crossiella sp. SN42]MCO1582392.1 neutral zinc metallopeptidase [Crossiella sp. SN42]
MRFNEDAELDVSQVEDLGGSGGGGVGSRVAIGGGGLGVVGLLIWFLLSQFGGGALPSVPGGAADRDSVPRGEMVNSGKLAEKCRTGADANRSQDCAAIASINSIQGYWTDVFARSGRTYRKATTNFFNGAVRTGCGNADSAVGPFYCPADNEVYIDLSFFKELQDRFGAAGGTFVEAYVLAHEYGHHVQNLLGTSDQVRGNATGPESGSVRLELQADCYAGAWAKHATTVPTPSGKPLIAEITDDDIKRALDAAARIGDDFIQSQLNGRKPDPSQFSHGSSKQRQKWFSTGLKTGNPASCNTFDRNVDLG